MHEVEKDIALSLGLPSPQEKVERREIESDETSSCLARTQLKDLGRRTPPYIIGTFYFLGVNLVARGVEANSRLIASITFARCSGLRRFMALFSLLRSFGVRFCIASASRLSAFGVDPPADLAGAVVRVLAGGTVVNPGRPMES